MPKKVFVSGCYDMLHSGHVAFFEEAASHGDLYVGLGSDQTIWGLKARKTINNNAERLYMVKAIRFVKDAWINSGSGIYIFLFIAFCIAHYFPFHYAYKSFIKSRPEGLEPSTFGFGDRRSTN